MLEENIITRIKILLQPHPKGLTITEISSRLKMNRNSVAKYLEVLLISGQVETMCHRLRIDSLFYNDKKLVLAYSSYEKCR
jgi:predicted transcriptional regulator